ncbi:MAG: hypothetical protein ACRD6X_03430, partial [Pyrinomonadaceae bacterium]
MQKSQKELAFIRDLYLTPDWTRRFAELADKHLDLADVENVLYLNAGTGDHCFAIREKLDERISVFGACENEDLLGIARDKAIALRADVDFSTIEFEDDSFDAVIADLSLAQPKDIEDFVNYAVGIARSRANVIFFLPSSGSFGEVFSELWEVLFNNDLGDQRHIAETLVEELHTVSRLKSLAESAGLINVRTETSNEIFEFENGAAFVEAPLVANFLMPHWLETLSENEKEQVVGKLARLIDEEDGTMPFQFSVKATVVT